MGVSIPCVAATFYGMRKYLIMVYWLLLIVPALATGVWALRLLKHDQERLARLTTVARQARVNDTAVSLAAAVAEVQDGLLESLAQASGDGLRPALEALERENPLVRNVFIWQAAGRLLLPDPGAVLSQDQRSFLHRYDALFSGRLAWDKPYTDGPRKVTLPDAQQARVDTKRDLSRLARNSTANLSGGKPGSGKGDLSRYRQGWMPWFSDNQLYFVGWLRPAEDAPVYGLELETTALVSRFLPIIAGAVAPGETCALLDGNGNVVHASGARELGAGIRPELTAFVGPIMPHWQVAYWGPATAAGGHGFLVLSGLLLAIFVAAIVFGGSMLLWQAHTERRDALQKTTFVSNVSHELKTPLTTIRMYAELLGEGRVKEPAKRDNYLGIIVNESHRLTRLVNNVLDFSRLEQRRKNYRREKLDIAQCLSDLADAQRPRLEEAGMNLELELPDGHVLMEWDRDALEQVLLNLLDNAVKYAREGGELRFVMLQETDGWDLEVLDRGPGVPWDLHERIFDKFFRADDKLTARQPGCGLGLSLARQMMRDLGGDLFYEPREGGGACFHVLFFLPGRRRLGAESKRRPRGLLEKLQSLTRRRGVSLAEQAKQRIREHADE